MFYTLARPVQLAMALAIRVYRQREQLECPFPAAGM